MAEYNTEKEIAAIGVCMQAVDGLELSEALRVVAYVCHFLEVHEIKDRAYALAREAVAIENRSATAQAKEGAS